MLRERLEQIEKRIGEALDRCGRKRSEITLLAVTKKFAPSIIEEAYALGLREFGENYVQEFESKAPALQSLGEARFHLIGHLQANKTRRASELFQVIETVDSAKLAARLDQSGNPLDVLLEVKLASEESKSGAAAEELPALIEAVRNCTNLRLRGR